VPVRPLQDGGSRSSLDPRLLDRLQEARRRFQDVETQLSDPAVLRDPERLKELGQERAHLEEVAAAAGRVDALVGELEGARQLSRDADDAEMRSLAEEDPEAAATVAPPSECPATPTFPGAIWPCRKLGTDASVWNTSMRKLPSWAWFGMSS
jgi:hypothetical protein